MASDICRDILTFRNGLGPQTSFCVVTEDDFLSPELRSIGQWIDNQPSWSDLPFIILTRRGGGPERSPNALLLSDLLRNVTFLERPFHPTTFISMARVALKARQRQHDARARIDELNESRERLRTALLAGRLGSWEVDVATWELRASRTCKAIFGRFDNEDFSYNDWVGAIHPEDRSRVLEAVDICISSGDDMVVEYRSVWPDRTHHWAEIQARLVRGLAGQGPQLVGVSSDITSRKMVEENLKLLNETLEARVIERTAELKQAHEAVLGEIEQRERTEEQLRQAQKMETIGQLTGGVAHDFNNLLMVILGNLNMLRKRVPEDPRIMRLIDGALQGAQRGAALTQRLLAFARRQELTVESRNLIDLIYGMTDLLHRSVGSQIELRFDLPQSLSPALVDANQVELALLNLVVNARDAMPQGGTLTVKADEIDLKNDSGQLPSGHYVRLIVSDTGQGMDDDTLRRATEPFFSTKGIGKGTGLGLSMIHGLALQLNGDLRLSSDLGRGTRAELWLPSTSTAVAAPPQRIRELAANNAPKLTILVVDDDSLIASSTVDMLEDLGHRVIEANSGASALVYLENDQRIDLLITDYAMPKMTGVQLAKAARELRPNLPILLATGFAELPHGVDLNLPRLGKPYLQDQLQTEIAKILKSKAA